MQPTDNDIIETRKKRKKACSREIQINHSASVEQGSNSSANKYNKMTVKQWRQEIKSASINVRGLAKLKKIELVEILKQNL